MESTDREALNDIDSRIDAIERRLRNAKMARDAYIDFLRSKYPSWRGVTLSTYQKPMFTEHRRDFLVNDLATADYHWDIGRENFNTRIPIASGKLYNSIPQRGPLLQSDVVLMRHRLQEISNQLRVMREHRIHLPTQEYTNIRDTTDVFGPQDLHLNEESDEMTELRRRIEGIDISEMPRLRSPTKIDLQQAEEEDRQEALIKEIRETQPLPLSFFSEPSRDYHPPLILSQPFPVTEHGPIQSNSAPAIRALALSHPTTEAPTKSTVTFKAEEAGGEAKTQPKQQSKQEAPQTSQQSKDLSKVMSMFGNQTTTDTESDETPLPARRNPPTQPISSILPSYSSQQPPKVDLLSQYLGKSKDKDPLGKLLQSGKADDSDDDFFK